MRAVTVDLEIALEFVNGVLVRQTGKKLRTPEITIFRGTWQGMTYEQMAKASDYSANYLMRDIAPKFWKLLSATFKENIGKNNLRIKLCHLYAASVNKAEIVNNSVSKASATQTTRDWGNAVDLPSVFYGRTKELATIQQWIWEEKCQLIKLWGLSGTGKTLLMKNLGEKIQHKYDVVIWRSLLDCPSLTSLIGDLLYSSFGIVRIASSMLLTRLITAMKSRSCLIMLDGMEAILKPNSLNEQFLAGYEDYGDFLRIVAESSHQSCVVITSLENFGITMPRKNSLRRNLKLSGLWGAEAEALLKAENLSASNNRPQARRWQGQELTIDSARSRLVEYYQGNPAILIFAAQIIRELFNGNVAEFLEQKTLVFGEINRLLNKSFSRLSPLEKEILYWLASEPKPMSLSQIHEGIPLSIYPGELIEAIKSLTRRSLLSTTQIKQRSVFVLSAMIRELTINQFINQIGDNFSVDSRKNSLLAPDTIELSENIKKSTDLSQWLENRFTSDWQPVEALFAALGRSPARLRSAFNLRGTGTIKKFKQIKLGQNDPLEVLLLIAIEPEESALKICVQVQPAVQEPILPANLQLKLIDPTDTILATIKSKVQDNFIQLPYFRGVKSERFKIGIDFASFSYQEEFII